MHPIGHSQDYQQQQPSCYGQDMPKELRGVDGYQDNNAYFSRFGNNLNPSAQFLMTQHKVK